MVCLVLFSPTLLRLVFLNFLALQELRIRFSTNFLLLLVLWYLESVNYSVWPSTPTSYLFSKKKNFQSQEVWHRAWRKRTSHQGGERSDWNDDISWLEPFSIFWRVVVDLVINFSTNSVRGVKVTDEVLFPPSALPLHMMALYLFCLKRNAKTALHYKSRGRLVCRLTPRGWLEIYRENRNTKWPLSHLGWHG